MSDSRQREIEQFLYREARLLDQRRFHEWIELLADDIHYWMPVRTSRYEKTSKSIVILDDDHYRDTELSTETELAILDEDKESLRMRIARLDTGMAWAEDPPSRTRHFLSNIEIEASDHPSEFKVYCNIIVYRSRGETEQDFFVGSREDMLRQTSADWLVASRKIVLDQNVLLAKNVSIFF